MIGPDPCVGTTVVDSIIAGDNGSDADDSFALTLNGVVLGTTTVGGSNSLSASNLVPGTYEVLILVAFAPDDCRTWFIQLNDGLTFADGTTFFDYTDLPNSCPPEGASFSYTVIVPA